MTSFHVSSAPDTAGNACSAAVEAGMAVHDQIGTQGIVLVFAFFFLMTFIKRSA